MELQLKGRVPTDYFLDNLKKEFIDAEWLNGTLWVNPKCWKSTICMVFAVLTCPTNELKSLEYYGLKASSLDAVPIGGTVNVYCQGRDSIRFSMRSYRDYEGNANIRLK